MNTYKIIFSYPGEPIEKLSYITVKANSEGQARQEARKELSKLNTRFANIYAAKKQ